MKNILEFLERTSAQYADKTAFADEESALSFAQVQAMARSGGSELIRRGLKNEPVVVFMKKAPQTIAAFFSVIYAGCMYVPMDVGMPLHRVRMILKKLSPNAIICDES